MVPLPDGVPPWLIALVPLAVIAVVVTHLVLQSRRGEFGRDAAGRRRVPWVWPVVIAIGAFALLSVATRL